MIKIGVDISGGDFAPEATVKGAILAQREMPADCRLVCIGDEDQIKTIAKREGFDTSVFDIVHTKDNIGMGEHPAKAYQQKENASIPIGFKMLKSKQLDGFASAGSTGAMMVGAMIVIKAISGVIRPAIATFMPSNSDIPTLLLDVGLNADTKAESLLQNGILGSLYVEHVFNIKKPRVGILNIGAEEDKGNLLVKAAFPLFKECKAINFIGNVEGHDFYSKEKADVFVCDGFVGNIVLKSSEAIYDLVKQRNIHDPFFEKFNYENYGGTPILGIDAVAVIGHGISNDKAIKNMILQTYQVAQAGLVDKIKEAFK